jgi:hypothetical protein
VRIAAIRSSSSSSFLSSTFATKPTHTPHSVRDEPTRGPREGSFGVREVTMYGKRIGQLEVARVLVSAAERSRLLQERDALMSLHQQVAREHKAAARERVALLTAQAQAALDGLRRQEERGEKVSEAELQQAMQALHEAIASEHGSAWAQGGAGLRSDREAALSSRRLQAQPQQWRYVEWLSTAPEVRATFVTKCDEAFRGDPVYRSMYAQQEEEEEQEVEGGVACRRARYAHGNGGGQMEMDDEEGGEEGDEEQEGTSCWGRMQAAVQALDFTLVNGTGGGWREMEAGREVELVSKTEGEGEGGSRREVEWGGGEIEMMDGDEQGDAEDGRSVESEDACNAVSSARRRGGHVDAVAGVGDASGVGEAQGWGHEEGGGQCLLYDRTHWWEAAQGSPNP